MLECSNIACIRGERVIFKNLSFAAKEGSLTLITGKNGSGKTSLLRIIVGLLPTRFGSVTLNGEKITTSSSCISDITYVGHKNACRENMVVLDALKFWTDCRRTEELVESAIHFFGFHNILYTKFRHLSCGWKRKVALARLLISNTHVWLIDEPFTNLDHNSVELVRNLILTRVERRGIVLLAGHGPEKVFEGAQVIHLDGNLHAESSDNTTL